MSGSKVFITGLGAITASGATADENLDAVLAGRIATGPIEEWDIDSWDQRLGGEIRVEKLAALLPDRKLLKAISRQDVFGIHAAMQAIDHSGLMAFRDTLPDTESFDDTTGIYVGSPGNKYFQQYDFLPLVAESAGDMQQFAGRLFDVVHPMWLLRILPNNVLAYTGISCGFKGPNHNISNHATGGAQALLEAFHAIRTGLAERVVVVAYDVGTEPQALFYYDRLGVLSRTGLRPFDASHDGTILAEGAAAMVLESESSVKSRGATCFGEMLGGMCATESGGLFSLDFSGEPLAALLQKTLDACAMRAEDVGLIVAHGNGNPLSDDSEVRALEHVLPDTPVTAFKWSMGHTVAASGLIDALLANQVLAAGKIPGVSGYRQPAVGSPNLSAVTRLLEGPPVAMVINRGFGGMNVCLMLRACEQAP